MTSSEYSRRLIGNTTNPFIGAALKIKRANRHLEELAHAARTFPLRHGYAFALSKPEPGKLEITYMGTTPMPVEFAPILGDAIHNIRSAFDHIAVALASPPLGTGNPKNIYFPTGVNRKEFIETLYGYQTPKGKKIPGKIKGASADAPRMIEDLEPYNGGKNSIRELHDLDVLDKHKLLIPSASLLSVEFLNLSIGDKKVPLGRADFQPNAGGRSFTAVVDCPEDIGDDFKLDDKFKPAFEIVFHEGQPLGGKPIVPSLFQLSNLGKSFIQACEIAFLPNFGVSVITHVGMT